MYKSDILERLKELIGIGEAILGTRRPPPPRVLTADFVDSAKFEKWRMSCLNLLIIAFGESNIYVKEFTDRCKNPQIPDAERGYSILLSVRSDLLAGIQDGPNIVQYMNTHFNQEASQQSQADPRKVFVVHGRNQQISSGVFGFLRSLHLDPIEWSEAVNMTRQGSPYVGAILDVAFAHAQAIVVLMTPDDEAKLREEFINDDDLEHERNLTPQARPNVLFEAGLAFGRQPERTILVEVGRLRPFSDIAGRHVIRMDNSRSSRQELANRLSTAGCEVDMSGQDWLTEGNFEIPAFVAGTSSTGLRGQDSPFVPTLQLFIRTREVRFGTSGKGSWPETDGDIPKQIIAIETDMEAQALMHVESLNLKILGQSMPCFYWSPINVGVGFDYSQLRYFALPSEVSAGQYEVTLEAFSKGHWWGSHPFTIDVPSPSP